MESKWVAVILLIALVCVFGYYNGWFAEWGYPPPEQVTPTPTPTAPSGQAVGTFIIKALAYNSLDITSALTIGTDVDITYLAYRGGGWVVLGSYVASGREVELTPQDNGYIYIMCTRHGSTNYFLDVAKTLAMNSRAVSYQFIDVTGDTVKEFVIQYSMANLPQPPSGFPTTTFTAFFLYDDSGSADFPAGGRPSDITGIGGSLTTKYIAWYFGLSQEKRAVAVSKIEIRVNTTFPSKAELVSVNVPGRGVVSASSMTYQQLTNEQVWTLSFGTDLSHCLIWSLPEGQLNKFDLTTQVRLLLSSGDILQWTINVYLITAGQSTVVKYDSVITKYASS